MRAQHFIPTIQLTGRPVLNVKTSLFTSIRDLLTMPGLSAQDSPFGTSNLVMRALVLTVWAYRNHLWKENNVSLAAPLGHGQMPNRTVLVTNCGH